MDFVKGLQQLGQAVGFLPTPGAGPTTQTTTAATDQNTAAKTADFHEQSRTTSVAGLAPVVPTPAKPEATLLQRQAMSIAEEIGTMIQRLTGTMESIKQLAANPNLTQEQISSVLNQLDPTQLAGTLTTNLAPKLAANIVSPVAATPAISDTEIAELMKSLGLDQATAPTTPQVQATPTTATYNPMNPTAGSMTTTIPNNQVPATTNANTANNTLTPQAAPQAAAQDPTMAMLAKLLGQTA